MKKLTWTSSKKKPFTAGVVLLAALLSASCSQEDLPVGGGTEGSGGATPLQVDGILLEKSVESRAATTLAVDGDSIGIFRSKETGYDAAQKNIPYVYSASKWAPAEASKPVWLLAGNANVCAYYPYNAAYADSTLIPLTAGVYGDSAVVDLCFAPNRVMNGTPAKSKTTFAMKHAMAMMVFTLKKGDFPGPCRVADITLMNDSLPATATFDITSADNTPVALTKADLTYTPAPVADGADGSVVPTAAGVTARDVLLVPFALSGDFSVMLTVDGKDMKLDLAPATFANAKIEAGKRYLLTLKINATALQVTNVTIEDWVDFAMTDTDGKDYEPFPKQLPPHAIEINGLSFYVADANVRAVKQADNSYKYIFAENQGYFSGVDGAYDPAGGDYFAWNTLDPAATTSSNTTNVWNPDNDPCRKIEGGQWYTPTLAQWEALFDKRQWYATYMLNANDYLYGTYFGIDHDPEPSEQEEYVFLTGGGWRDGDNIVKTREEGCYWSTTVDAATGKLNACRTALPGNMSHLESYHDRNNGYFVRCVQDKPKEVPAHAIEVEGLDFYVADGNVRAIKQADNTYKYSFAEEQGYYSGVKNTAYDPAGGDYFCWNTLSPDDFNVTQTEWKDERDPCRQIEGGQWYIPTNDQWEKFRELNTAGKAVWGTYTMKDDTTTKYGWYFGTAPGTTDVPKADQDKYVFLPAAGYHTNTSTIYDEGSYGRYWSSTQRDNGDAYGLLFDGSSMYAGTFAGLRYTGFSVRCVRNK